MQHELFTYYKGRIAFEKERADEAKSAKDYLILKFTEMKAESERAVAEANRLREQMDLLRIECRQKLEECVKMCVARCNQKLKNMHFL